MIRNQTLNDDIFVLDDDDLEAKYLKEKAPLTEL